MPHRVCPHWVGYLLASPIRRLIHKPERILEPFVSEGMTTLDVGPGMGFFSFPLAKMVGPKGTVVCVDVQEKMVQSLQKRVDATDFADRIVARVCGPTSLNLDDFVGQIDFALAFAVVHEMPDIPAFFAGIRKALKPNGQCLIAEPKGHVPECDFDATLVAAGEKGFSVVARPTIRGCHAVVLKGVA